MRRIGSPPPTCCTQISRLPSVARSDAKASNLPSLDKAGAVLRPASAVTRRRSDFVSASGRRKYASERNASAAQAGTLAPMASHRQRRSADGLPVSASAGSSKSFSTSCRMSFTSDMCCQRSINFFWRHFVTTRSRPRGNEGRISRSGRGSFETTAESVSSEVSARKARRPLSISYRTEPKEKMSDRASTAWPWACSGDI